MWERGIGGARSRVSPASSKSAGDLASVGDAEGAIRCERTILGFCGDDGARSRPAPPGPPLPATWSAIVGLYDHVSNVNNSKHGRRRLGEGRGVERWESLDRGPGLEGESPEKINQRRNVSRTVGQGSGLHARKFEKGKKKKGVDGGLSLLAGAGQEN